VSWHLVNLGECVDILSGFAFKSSCFNDSGDGLPLVRIRDVVRGESNTYYSGEYAELYVLKNDDLLIGMDGDFNREKWTGGKALLNQRVCKITADPSVLDQQYLYHFLPKELLRIHASTPAVTVKHLSVKGIRAIEIPLPYPDDPEKSLKEQKRIAAILDKADGIRRKRQQAIQLADDFLRSVFLDMFGDPVANPKGWEMKVGGEHYDVRGRVGWKGYKKTDLRDEGSLVLGATHITNLGEVNLTKPVYLSEEKYLESPEIMVELNDLLFVQRGNTIGKIALVDNELGEATINPVLLILRPQLSNPIFLLNLLMNERQKYEIISFNSGSAQPMITQKSMKECSLINPPVSLQNRFSEMASKIEQKKELAKKSLQKSDGLFNSLSQLAFNGEL